MVKYKNTFLFKTNLCEYFFIQIFLHNIVFKLTVMKYTLYEDQPGIFTIEDQNGNVAQVLTDEYEAYQLCEMWNAEEEIEAAMHRYECMKYYD